MSGENILVVEYMQDFSKGHDNAIPGFRASPKHQVLSGCPAHISSEF